MRSVLPGRPQSSRQALCTVNWDGLRLVAYISGNTVVVFNGRRDILQSISVDDANILSSLIIEEASGQIAVSDTNTVYLYQPFGRDYGDLRWTRTCTLPHETEESIQYLSWGAEDELLVAGDRLTLWNLSSEDKPQVVWASNLSSPVSIACFSPDASLIASCGQHDRLVKIWRRLSYEQDSTRFDVSYLPHTSVVTNLSWRSFWHQEQNLDNVLYTFCADNHVQVWAHSEQHAYNTMQQIASIDASASIQPRRLSIGSVSKNRFVFLLESRDLARAAERSLQIYQTGTDHALENFIQIVSRSPEICVILDGLGHMSAWGIENAGLRNKQDPEKFNVALVDGVDISLPSGRSLDDQVRIHAFANNDVSASLCILVHSYTGQIDWYQGSFVEFFNTAARAKRTNLLSCWSGHDAALERLVSSRDDKSFVSLDEQENAILWSKSSAGALVRQSRMRCDEAMLDATILGNNEFVVFLHDKELSVWDVRGLIARNIGSCELERGDPISICRIDVDVGSHHDFQVAVLFNDQQVETYGLLSASPRTNSKTNGYHGPFTRLSSSRIPDVGKEDTVGFCIASHLTSSNCEIISLSDIGEVKVFNNRSSSSQELLTKCSNLRTNSRASNVVTSIDGRIHAFAHTDYQTVSIWNASQTACEFARTFDHLDLLQELYWHSTQHGELILALQFPFDIVVVGQRRYSMNEETRAWEVLQIIHTREYSTNHVNSLCWVWPCQLVLGMGSQIHSIDLHREATASAITGEGSDREILHDVPQYLQIQNSSLSSYDPELLGQCFESGDFDLVSMAFHALHEQLRFHVQGEEIDHDLNGLFKGKQSGDLSSVLSNGVSDQSTTQTRDGIPDITDFHLQFIESVNKISETQLPVGQRCRLQTLVRIFVQLWESQGSLDTYALNYYYHFLSATANWSSGVSDLPPLPMSAIAHATLSQTQEALIHSILSTLERLDIKFTWQNARSLGIFLFVSDVEALRMHLESVAKAEYNRNPDDRNPVDCSLYYLALDKKAILQLLWRRTVGMREKENTMKLLSRDFKDAKAKATALKNAYALLSKRRFEYAAAFFLLGGNLADAVNVCVNQLRDVQLGIAIARAWSGSSSAQELVMSKLIDKDIQDFAIDTHEARWLGIWGSIYRESFHNAIRYIVDPVDQLFESQLRSRRTMESNEKSKRDMPYAVYDYRVNEPGSLIKMYLSLRAMSIEQRKWTREVTSAINEKQFIMRCATWYARAGMDILALQLVAQWQFVAAQEVVNEEKVRKAEIPTHNEQNQKSALDEWIVPDTGTAFVNDGGSRKESKVDEEQVKAKKPPPTQFLEPSADSLLDSFGF